MYSRTCGRLLVIERGFTTLRARSRPSTTTPGKDRTNARCMIFRPHNHDTTKARSILIQLVWGLASFFLLPRCVFSPARQCLDPAKPRPTHAYGRLQRRFAFVEVAWCNDFFGLLYLFGKSCFGSCAALYLIASTHLSTSAEIILSW